MEIKQAEYFKGAVEYDQMPEEGLCEFLFCGRSNVGKSSFINMLTNRKSLARTSSTPGKTQIINFFLINNSFFFVDVPGYGYAKVSKEKKKTFGPMIDTYLKKRESLKMVFLLVDFRHKPSEDDVLMYEYLKYYNKPVTVIATKADKVKNKDRKSSIESIKETLNLKEEDKMIITSSEKRTGFGETLSLIDEILANNTTDEE